MWIEKVARGKSTAHPRKTTVNRRKTTLNRRISGSCYRSFRLNGTIFRRNSSSGKYLGKAPPSPELMCNLREDLRPNSANRFFLIFHKIFSINRLRQPALFSRGVEV